MSAEHQSESRNISLLPYASKNNSAKINEISPNFGSFNKEIQQNDSREVSKYNSLED